MVTGAGAVAWWMVVMRVAAGAGMRMGMVAELVGVGALGDVAAMERVVMGLVAGVRVEAPVEAAVREMVAMRFVAEAGAGVAVAEMAVWMGVASVASAAGEMVAMRLGARAGAGLGVLKTAVGMGAAPMGATAREMVAVRLAVKAGAGLGVAKMAVGMGVAPMVAAAREMVAMRLVVEAGR